MPIAVMEKRPSPALATLQNKPDAPAASLGLTLLFYGILTPVAMIMRVFGRDALNLKCRSNTYWVKPNRRIDLTQPF